jgi:serine/threonine protein phosphatase 1
MPLLAIGDIHGCLRSLETLIQKVNPTPDDQLIFLGDYVNRGPDSRGVIQFLIDLSKRHRCVFLRGNHEIMMLSARLDESIASSWRMCGGRETLRSYDAPAEGNWPQHIPAEHWEFLEKTERMLVTPHHIFVHACLDPDRDLDKQPDEVLFWERFGQIQLHPSGKKIICGHTADQDGLIDDRGFATCIDTGAVFGAWLTCLNVETGRYWQTNQKSASRQGQCPNWKERLGTPP